MRTTLYHAEQGAKEFDLEHEIAGDGWHDNPGKVGLVAVERNHRIVFEKVEQKAAEPVAEVVEMPKRKGGRPKKVQE